MAVKDCPNIHVAKEKTRPMAMEIVSASKAFLEMPRSRRVRRTPTYMASKQASAVFRLPWDEDLPTSTEWKIEFPSPSLTACSSYTVRLVSLCELNISQDCLSHHCALHFADDALEPELDTV